MTWNWALFIRDSDGWFVFKVFNEPERALKSHNGFRAKGFDCLLVYTLNKEHLLDIQRLLALTKDNPN